ncbi:LOW QUALITY PROTEIN: 39S ribosomal protein L9, mitochondrial [Pristis pectinata]|uniref:LOW QUALITY PROTEIN: 39S ribosomal protein L9, mitochondrial n=1 Tax=Pristis pectinata TaxID=685728 RepID=UPI00223D5F06|nr:LOW QUALITY PROTEIN: 39S ribosomal protein L9, mitochondrial [Pristis pectinata]
MWRRSLQRLLRAGGSGGGGGGPGEAAGRGVAVSAVRGTVMVERWWQVPLPKEGKPARLHPRRHRVYRLVEDTKHSPQERLELILTQTVPKLGDRGDTVFVKKAIGRNRLLPQGLAVYASPENKALFKQERMVLQEGGCGGRGGRPPTVEFLKGSRLMVRMKNNVKWELSRDIVCRHFLRELQVFVPPAALRIPDEPITRWGEYWCEVTVSDTETKQHPPPVTRTAPSHPHQPRSAAPITHSRGQTQGEAPSTPSHHTLHRLDLP